MVWVCDLIVMLCLDRLRRTICSSLTLSNLSGRWEISLHPIQRCDSAAFGIPPDGLSRRVLLGEEGILAGARLWLNDLASWERNWGCGRRCGGP